MPVISNPLSQALHTHHPHWQAPLPFDLISAETSGKISANGALGLLRIPNYYSLSDLEQRIDNYKRHHARPSFCFAHILPHHQAPNFQPDAQHYLAQQLNWHADAQNLPKPASFEQLLDTALSTNPRAIGFANGLPDQPTIQKIRQHNVYTFAICHNLAEIIVAQHYQLNAIVLQGHEAGGEHSRFPNQLPELIQPAHTLLQQARTHLKIPLIYWGDLTTPTDSLAVLLSGAQAIMHDRPWLACQENNLPESLRQQILHGNEFNSALNHHYTAHPMRYLKNAHSIDHSIDNPHTREGYLASLLASAPNKRPLPIALSPIADPKTIPEFLHQQQQGLNTYLA